jgi:hypothetical protein
MELPTEPTLYECPFNTKRVIPYGPDGYKVAIDHGKKTTVIIISREDLEAIIPLDIKTQVSRGKERALIWAQRKSLSLGRYILEEAEPREDMAKLYVRHRNENTLDFRRGNLVWSLGPSGRIVTPEVGDRRELQRKVVLKWKGFRLLFLTKEEAEAAKKRLDEGESPYNILQTGRKRNRSLSEVGGPSIADWAIWLRQRQIEMSDIRAWMTGVREPRPHEDEYLRRILDRGWTQFGTESARLLAVGVAEWMNREAQSEPVLPLDNPGYGTHRSTVIAKALTFHDPFEDFTELFSETYANWAYPEMPQVKASFSLKSEVD